MKYAFTIKNSNSPIEEILFLYQLLSSVSLDFFLFVKSMVSSYSTHEKYGQKTCLKNFSCKTCCWLVQILLRNENVLNQSSCLDSWKDCEIENLPHYFFKILSIRLNLYQKCLKIHFCYEISFNLVNYSDQLYLTNFQTMAGRMEIVKKYDVIRRKTVKSKLYRVISIKFYQLDWIFTKNA